MYNHQIWLKNAATVKPVFVATSIKQATCIKQACIQFPIQANTLKCTCITLKCLSIGTPKIINFPFVSNGKLMFFKGPNIQAHCNEAVLCLNFGTPENNEFSIWNKWKIYYF